MKSKFVGSMLGSGIGDALGASLGGLAPKRMEEIFEDASTKSWGRYTDDTQMMIGVAESLIEKMGFDGENMAKTFIENFDPSRGYGLGPPVVFRLIKSGLRWNEASKLLFEGAGSFGNGSAMRIAPIGLFYHDDPSKLRSVAYDSSLITHAHELGKEGAALQARAIALAVNSKHPLNKEEFLDKLIGFVSNEVYKLKLRKLRILVKTGSAKSDVIRELGNSIEAFNSVPTAIYSFLHFDCFAKSVVYAVSLGGDADTIGAMTGAIAGAFYGVEGIPEEWKMRLENADYIENLAERLWEMKTGSCR